MNNKDFSIAIYSLFITFVFLVLGIVAMLVLSSLSRIFLLI